MKAHTGGNAFHCVAGQPLPKEQAVHRLTRAVLQDLRDTAGCSESGLLLCWLCDHLCGGELSVKRSSDGFLNHRALEGND